MKCQLLAALVLFAACQNTPNYYQGKIQDDAGKPLSDVLVTEDHGNKSTRTDARGYFRLEDKEEWMGSLVFSKNGYRTDTLPTVYHQAGETTEYRFIKKDTTRVVLVKNKLKMPVVTSKQQLATRKAGTEITGDFDGDGQMEEARQTLIKKGEGNPVEDGTPDEYAIRFPESSLPGIPVNCCDFRLVNEGDLDGDGREELSIFQAPMNGCTYTMHTYTFKNGFWKDLFPPFMIPTACEPFTDQQLQQRIFLEQGTIFYYRTDANKEQFPLVKTPVLLK